MQLWQNIGKINKLERCKFKLYFSLTFSISVSILYLFNVTVLSKREKKMKKRREREWENQDSVQGRRESRSIKKVTALSFQSKTNLTRLQLSFLIMQRVQGDLYYRVRSRYSTFSLKCRYIKLLSRYFDLVNTCNYINSSIL